MISDTCSGADTAHVSGSTVCTKPSVIQEIPPGPVNLTDVYSGAGITLMPLTNGSSSGNTTTGSYVVTASNPDVVSPDNSTQLLRIVAGLAGIDNCVLVPPGLVGFSGYFATLLANASIQLYTGGMCDSGTEMGGALAIPAAATAGGATSSPSPSPAAHRRMLLSTANSSAAVVPLQRLQAPADVFSGGHVAFSLRLYAPPSSAGTAGDTSVRNAIVAGARVVGQTVRGKCAMQVFLGRTGGRSGLL